MSTLPTKQRSISALIQPLSSSGKGVVHELRKAKRGRQGFTLVLCQGIRVRALRRYGGGGDDISIYFFRRV